MTKFKIIRWILKFFISLFLLLIAANTSAIYTILYDSSVPKATVTLLCTSIPITLMFVIGLYYIHQSCTMFIRRGYFNTKSAQYLSTGGYIMMIKAIISLILIAVFFDAKKDTIELIRNLESNVSFNTILIIIGLSLVAISDIIKQGEIIKTENDLTV